MRKRELLMYFYSGHRGAGQLVNRHTGHPLTSDLEASRTWWLGLSPSSSTDFSLSLPADMPSPPSSFFYLFLLFYVYILLHFFYTKNFFFFFLQAFSCENFLLHSKKSDHFILIN